MTNLFKTYDNYIIYIDFSQEKVVEVMKDAIEIRDSFNNELFDYSSKVRRPYYGTFSPPNKFVIRPNFGLKNLILPKFDFQGIETEIDINKLNENRSTITFKENNFTYKFIFILMALPFIGLFIYFSIKFGINFLLGLVLLGFAAIPLIAGTLIISWTIKSKENYFKIRMTKII